MPTEGPKIELINLTVKLDGVEIVGNLNEEIPAGRTTALIGPNGSGKTTTLLAILGLVHYKGEIKFTRDGKKLRYRPVIGYVPQRLAFDRGLPLTVLDFLALQVQKQPLWWGISPKIRKRADDYLQPVEASHLTYRPLGKLSGGELQRVLLAKALIEEPEVVLLDEPAAAIDPAGGELFCDLLENLQRKYRFTLLMVSHDLSIVTHHADYVICLNRDIHCAGETLAVLNQETLLRIYGPHMGVYEHAHPEEHKTSDEGGG
jgi:zinc transport system ATP-binding protein